MVEPPRPLLKPAAMAKLLNITPQLQRLIVLCHPHGYTLYTTSSVIL